MRSIINIAQIVLVVILLVNAALVWWRHLNITSKQKNREWDRKQNLSPTRTLRAEESRAIQELYQLEIPAGTEVFPISGRFRCNYVAEGELATKVSDHYWIGDFEVLYDDSWDTYLKDINLAEIVWQNKNIAQPACLLNLNGELDINYKPHLRYEEDHLIDTLPFTPPDLTPMEKRILSLVSTNGNDSRHRENPCQDIGTDPWQCNLYYATLLNALKINQDHSNAEKRLLEILAWETERWIAQWLLQRSQKMLAQGICLKGWKAHRLVGKFHLSLPDTPHLETYDIMQAFKSLKQVLREENLQRTTEISGVVAEVSANLLVLKGDLVSIGTALTRTLVFLTVIVIFVWNLRQMLLKQGKNK